MTKQNFYCFEPLKSSRITSFEPITNKIAHHSYCLSLMGRNAGNFCGSNAERSENRPEKIDEDTGKHIVT
jgi:hypothetical protein